ncbi:MAG: hypothetical protein JNK26_00510 [Candidatus Doudnabacteria bacterium]|nr:hypothetical protein [Candidatus Doudnabacteria bacterium]
MPNALLQGSNGEIIHIAYMHSNITVIKPGEAGVSGEFTYCLAVVCRLGANIYFFHNLPWPEDFLLENGLKIKQAGIIDIHREKFDEILVIGRWANVLASDKLRHRSKVPPQMINIGDPDKENLPAFQVVVYNDLENPGDLHNFDIRFKNELILPNEV